MIATVLVVASLAAAWWLAAGNPPSSARRQPAVSQVDEKPYFTARHLAQLADTVEELALAREAVRLSSRELDLAFAYAIRETAALKTPPALQPLEARLAAASSRVAKDRQLVDKLSKSVANSASQLDVAKAQLTLDEDDLEDARAEYDRAAGNEKAALERALDEVRTTEKVPVNYHGLSPAPPATLLALLQWHFGLNNRFHEVDDARMRATAKALQLERAHQALESPSAAKVAAPASNDDDANDEDPAELVDKLKRLSDLRKSLTDLDKRSQDLRQLAEIYARWQNAIWVREKDLLYRIFRLAAAFFAIVLVALIASRFARAYAASKADARGRYQAMLLARFAVWLLASAGAALLFFGPPSEASTLIGLTTAGLTVALKDFIVAIFGWFALIGKNGVHIGDWVEIEGVGGEVVDIGLFKTEILELGNWTNTGRPTGRRVSFMNNYAIEKHYFNFSTTGQWLWDQLEMTLPASDHAYRDAQTVLETVESETKADAEQAAHDWAAARAKFGNARTVSFSAQPTVDMRPSVTGLEVFVRYVTRAPQRYETKSRLLNAIVGRLH